MTEYQANLQVTEVQPRSRRGGNRWRTPPLGLVKINFDGAVFEDANMSGVGMVIRDNNGFVLASCSKKIPQAYKPDKIETLATVKALSFAHELGFRCAIWKVTHLG